MGRKMVTQWSLLLLVLAVVLGGCSPAPTPTPTLAPTPKGGAVATPTGGAVATATPATPHASAADTAAWLRTDLAAGEAVIWYLGHCGYAIRTQKHLLIFDYQEQYDGQARKQKPSAPGLENGFVDPRQIADLPVRVFATHSHTDHFNRLIFDWQDQIPDLAYYFGWQASTQTSYHYLIGPRAQLTDGSLEIYTINSQHSGVPEVAYLVKVDGLVIYHNGDYMGDFQADYSFLHEVTDQIDLAFTLRGYEDGSAYGNQNLDLFQRFRHGAIFPTHDTAGKSGYAEFERAFLAKLPGLPIFSPRWMGERFLYRDGHITREEAG